MDNAEKQIVANMVGKFFSTMCMNPKTYEVMEETLDTMGQYILDTVFKGSDAIDAAFDKWLNKATNELKTTIAATSKPNFTEPYEKGELFFCPWVFDKCKYIKESSPENKIWGDDSIDDEYFEDYFDESDILWWECDGWDKLVEVLQKEGIVRTDRLRGTTRWHFYWSNGRYFWTDKLPENAPIQYDIRGEENK